jgi:hypothetical protein
MLHGNTPKGNGPFVDQLCPFRWARSGAGYSKIDIILSDFCDASRTLRPLTVVGRIGPNPTPIRSINSSPATRGARQRGIGMPDKDLTVAQRTTLLTLMIKASPLARSFLVDTVKISLDKAKRDDLRDRKLITVTEGPLMLDLTEKGWARAIEELSVELPDGLPPRAGALGGTLYLLLGFLGKYLEQNDLSAAEFFAVGTPPRTMTAAPERAVPTEAEVESEIRKAYDELASSPGEYVMLDDLRRCLPGIAGEQVDAALRRLDGEPDIHLVPESNQKVLTAGQRAAALRIGNQNMHLLAIRL